MTHVLLGQNSAGRVGSGGGSSLIGTGFGAPVGTDDDTYSVSLKILSEFLGGR